MMKTFQRDVTQKRVLYGKGAASRQTQAQMTVATTMTMVNSSERRNRMGRKERSPKRWSGGGVRCGLGGSLGLEEGSHHAGQVGEDLGAGRQAAGGMGLLALAGQDQVGHAAADEAGLQVAQRIADRRHALQADLEALADLLEHAGLGLAAVAVVGGGVRAKEDGVDVGADQLRRIVHLLVDR